MFHKIQIKFDYGEIDIYHSWIMALFLLEDRDFKGFWMKIWNAGVSVITRSTFSSFTLSALLLFFIYAFSIFIYNLCMCIKKENFNSRGGGQIVYFFWKRTIWVHTWGLWQCRIICYLQGINLFCIYIAASRYMDSLYAFLYFQDSIFVINVFFLMYLD